MTHSSSSHKLIFILLYGIFREGEVFPVSENFMMFLLLSFGTCCCYIMSPSLDGELMKAGTELELFAYQPSSQYSDVHIEGIQYLLNDTEFPSGELI